MSELIEFRHLKYIVAVAETGNFTRASERLFVSQPSLSRQIKDIEAEIGFQIFIRTPDGVFPTPLGQVIVDYASATLHGRTNVLRITKEIFLGNIPPLRMGFSSFVAVKHLNGLRSIYGTQFPGCSIQFSGGITAHILQKLERGDLDCAIVPQPIVGLQWRVTHVDSSPLVACMRADDPLAEHSPVTIAELEKRLTVFRDPEGHPNGHARLLQMFSEAGIGPEIGCSATTPQDIQLLIRSGCGVALVAEDTAIEPGITVRHIAGVSWTADTAFVYRINAAHPALPMLEQRMLGGHRRIDKKMAEPQRPQLPLRFEASA